ncbi:hypothetical protein [Kitasatospora sp. Root107]|uniref:hypothetical protein n=1 Tax=Kitasatospora sp. Root107 TaxID=1736424 RepID=UPI0012FA8832|nr:hypothetical protein [Kitasatospora sp. Root107]
MASSTSAVRTVLSPRDRRTGKISEYRTVSPSASWTRIRTRASSTARRVARGQPRASPS